MIIIYFSESNADDAKLAQDSARKLRALGEKVLLSNTHMFRVDQLERAEHVVAINSPEVIEAYESRNAAIDAASGTRTFQGIPVTNITEDPNTLIEETSNDPDSDVDGDELGGMTRDLLADYAMSMLGLTLPANMRKADMITAIRDGLKAQTKPAEPEAQAAPVEQAAQPTPGEQNA